MRARVAFAVAFALGALASCHDNDDSELVPDQHLADSGTSGSAGTSGSSGDVPDVTLPDAEWPDAPPRGALDPNYRHFARNYTLCTGQSLSVGIQGTPVLSTAQPYDNQMFVGGVVTPNSAAARLGFAPLVEGPYETMESGFANRAHELAAPLLADRPAAERSHRMFISCHGVGGYSYSQLKKGTAPYANGIAQLDAAVALSAAEGASLVVRGVTNVHGEADEEDDDSPEYEGSVVQWQQDLEADVQARTGQTLGVPMFHSQMSSFTKFGAVISDVALAQLNAHVDHPRVHVLVGPKYFLPYAAVDGVHLTNEGYRWLGEYYAKAYQREILEGNPWEPLRPLGATRAGAVITIEFVVPAPPLQIDTTLVTDPGSYGFTFDDGSGAPPAITSVALADATHVTVTLAAEPTGPAPIVRYAFNAPLSSGAGPDTGPRGNLRDSDATPSSHGYTLYNWAVHFALATP